MKLEGTENLKLHSVNNIQTNITQINNIHNSDIDLSEKITEILIYTKKNPIFKGKPSFKNLCNYCRRYGHSIGECRQKQQDNQNKPRKYKEPNKSLYQYMKKDQNIPNKTFTVIIVLENHFQTVQNIQKINHLITLSTEADHQTKEIHVNSHKTDIVDQIVEIISIKKSIHDQAQKDQIILLIPVSIHILEIEIPMMDQEFHHTKDREIIPTIGIEATQIIEINDIKTIDHEIFQTTDQNIKDLTTTIIRVGHEITHKIGTQIITIDKEITLNHLIGIIHVIPILKTNIEAIHQNIKDK